MAQDPNQDKTEISDDNDSENESYDEDADEYRGAAGPTQIGMAPVFKMGGLMNKGQNQTVQLPKGQSFTKQTTYTMVDKKTTKDALLKQQDKLTSWDGISPLSTFTSTSLDPEQMSKQIKQTLTEACSQLSIDWEIKHPYLYAGTKYDDYGESQFQIRIFSRGNESDENSKCELEIRKLAGFSFGFAHFQETLVQLLLKEGCIEKDQGELIGELEFADEKQEQTAGFCTAPMSVIGFDIMTEDESSVMASSTDTENKSKEFEMKQPTISELINGSTDIKAFRDDIRFRIFQLHDVLTDSGNQDKVKQECKKEDVIKILDFCKSSFDTWIIKTLLQSVQLMLLKAQIQKDQQIKNKLNEISKIWSKEVVNNIKIDNMVQAFNFPKSSVIEKLCQDIAN